jgi:hypothetical protein
MEMENRQVVLFAALAVTLAGTASPAPGLDELIPGKIGVVKPAKLAKFVAKPAVGDFNLPGDDPSAEGASLRFFDTTGLAGDVLYILPAGGWAGLGKPAGAKGFKYKGAGTAGDPCKVVIIKPTVMKAVCKGADVTLTVPFGGDAGIILSVGDGTRYCLRYGGEAKGDPNKLLKRKDAPAPPACPVLTAPDSPTPTATFTNTPTATRTPTVTNTVPPGAPTATPTRTPTPTVGASGPVCGNNVIEPGETCAACPVDCDGAPCTVGMTTAQYDVYFPYPLEGDLPTSITTLLGFDNEVVEIQGAGFSIPGVLSLPQSGSSAVGNDLVYALRVTQNKTTGFNQPPPPNNRVYRVTFRICSGAPAPTLADFACTVEGCAGSLGQLIDGCTCGVAVP